MEKLVYVLWKQPGAAQGDVGSWTTRAAMPTPRQEMPHVVLNGRVYVPAGIDAARPGITSEDLWAAQNKVLEAAGAASGNDVGRSGHGLGMHLTEPPSNMPGDKTLSG